MVDVHLLVAGVQQMVGLLAALRTGLAAQVGLSAAVAQSIVPKATPSSAAHIRRAAVRGLGTFTWGFLRHSPASVLARGKNRGESRRVSVEKPWESPWESRGEIANLLASPHVPRRNICYHTRMRPTG